MEGIDTQEPNQKAKVGTKRSAAAKWTAGIATTVIGGVLTAGITSSIGNPSHASGSPVVTILSFRQRGTAIEVAGKAEQVPDSCAIWVIGKAESEPWQVSPPAALVGGNTWTVRWYPNKIEGVRWFAVAGVDPCRTTECLHESEARETLAQRGTAAPFLTTVMDLGQAPGS